MMKIYPNSDKRKIPSQLFVIILGFSRCFNKVCQPDRKTTKSEKDLSAKFISQLHGYTGFWQFISESNCFDSKCVILAITRLDCWVKFFLVSAEQFSQKHPGLPQTTV